MSATIFGYVVVKQHGALFKYIFDYLCKFKHFLSFFRFSQFLQIMNSLLWLWIALFGLSRIIHQVIYSGQHLPQNKTLRLIRLIHHIKGYASRLITYFIVYVALTTKIDDHEVASEIIIQINFTKFFKPKKESCKTFLFYIYL